MPFEKGREKTGGRKPGVQNKTTQEIRDKIQLVLSGKVEELSADLETMPVFKQWVILNSVAKYVLPTLNKNDNDTNVSGEIKVTVSFTDGDTAAISDYFTEDNN